MHRIVVPFLEMFRRDFTTAWARCESRPEVGSSQKRIAGWTRIWVPNERRFRSPPDIVLSRPDVGRERGGLIWNGFETGLGWG